MPQFANHIAGPNPVMFSVSQESPMGRSKLIQWVTVGVAALLAVTVFTLWQLESRFLYSHDFGSHRFGIEYGAETDLKGRRRILNTSF